MLLTLPAPRTPYRRRTERGMGKNDREAPRAKAVKVFEREARKAADPRATPEQRRKAEQRRDAAAREYHRD